MIAIIDGRIKVFSFIMFVYLSILIGGLGYTQIYMYEKYKVMSEENRLKVIPLMAPRGNIYDRENRPLVNNVLSFRLSVIYSRLKEINSVTRTVSDILGVPPSVISEKLKKAQKNSYMLSLIAEDIDLEKAIQLEEVSVNYPSFYLEAYAKREYLHGPVASGVLGYLGYINRTEFDRLKHYGYRINDMVGRDGVEKYYDTYLRGKHGGKQIEVDHRGREVTTIGYREPVSGCSLHLTIDLNLQKFCDDLLKDKAGSIVAMDPSTGAIYAMSSAPTFDPGVFLDDEKASTVGEMLKDKRYPLINRAIAGAYPPGSIYKAVVATAALESGNITEETTFRCLGHFMMGKKDFKCWKPDGHDFQTVKEAIKNSCNVFFYNTGRKTEIETMTEIARRFYLGRVTGIDLPGENPGVLPTPEWKKKRFGAKWYKGDTINYSIGQGSTMVSPLQIACMMSVFANGGYSVRPYIVEKIAGVTANTPVKTDLKFSPNTIRIVREGLRKVVNDVMGTGIKAKNDLVVVAGKTGTAQTSRGKNHGWFAGFAPFEDAKLTVVVFDEYGGKGGYYAAETAGKVFREAQRLGIL